MKRQNGADQRYYQLLYHLQTADFVLMDLNLYLDTHPDDVSALQQYNRTVQERWKIAHELEREFGPLTPYSYSHFPWQWDKAPWPWQV